MTFIIAIPTGVKFFNWIGTMWGGSLSFNTPMLWSIGFHTTFLVQHWLGVEGMPRRYADYLPDDGFTTLNQVSTVGAFLLAASTLPFLYNVYVSARGPKVGVDDPWGWGRSLEWATSCPPPRHNFTTLPRIRSESPAFDIHHPEIAARELAKNPRERGDADSVLVDAPDQAGRAEHLADVRAGAATTMHEPRARASRQDGSEARRKPATKRFTTALFVLAAVAVALGAMLVIGGVVGR